MRCHPNLAYYWKQRLIKSYSCETKAEWLSQKIRATPLVSLLCSPDNASSSFIRRAEVLLLFLGRHTGSIEKENEEIKERLQEIGNKTTKRELTQLVERLKRTRGVESLAEEKQD